MRYSVFVVFAALAFLFVFSGFAFAMEMHHDMSMHSMHMNAPAQYCITGSAKAFASGIEVFSTGGSYSVEIQKLSTEGDASTVLPQKNASFSFVVKDRDGNPVKEFDEVHTKLLHLIIASGDLTYFAHIHPEYKGNGLFEATALEPLVFPREGTFYLYLDYTPSGAVKNVSVIKAHVPSTARDETTNLWVEGKKTSGGFDVSLTPKSTVNKKGKIKSPFIVNRNVRFNFNIKDASTKKAAELAPLLGSYGHLVVLSENAQCYSHVHPFVEIKYGNDNKPVNWRKEMKFNTTFTQAGKYKLFAQFNAVGNDSQPRQLTAEFAIDVLEKKPQKKNKEKGKAFEHQHMPGTIG